MILIQGLVGFVFLSEGIQKFMFPESRGAGRFMEIGLPESEFFGYFVGSFEVISGIFVLLGVYTRIAVIPLTVIMVVAIFTTKIPILIDSGFSVMAHATRTDLLMLLCSIFLLVEGSGYFSIDMNYQTKVN